MALSAEDIEKVARAVVAFQNTNLEPKRDLYQVIRDGAADAKRAADQTKSTGATGLTEAQLDSLADHVADRLAARLAE